jgi:hypothetical protein
LFRQVVCISKQRMERLQRIYAYGVTEQSRDSADGTYSA